MHTIPIPIRAVTPESEEPLEFMPMPRGMSTFEMPQPPQPGPDSDLAGARELLRVFVQQMRAWLADAGQAPSLELAGLDPRTLRVLNETLGEGEVAAIVGDGLRLRIQETVFAGVWREQHFAADGSLQRDLLLAAPIPPCVATAARQQASAALRPLPLPGGAMNVPALLTELQDAMRRCGPATPPHVINLTLLPLSEADNAHLDALLDGGAVAILSRGFGNCRIGSTAARDVWRVQYFNNMNTLILNTLEVIAMPEVAIAAGEDLVESAERLDELVQWMGETIAA